MEGITVEHYDAFSSRAGMGNPAGIVLDADRYSETEMQEIAKKVGFNETAFICTSQIAGCRLRFFTPGHEMNLCGHATVASVVYLLSKGRIEAGRPLTIETGAGVIEVLPEWRGRLPYVTMGQAKPEFVPFEGDKEALAAALGLQVGDLHDTLPVTYASTGIWTLLVPIQSIEAFARMKPNNARFPEVLAEKPRCSVHPFCLGAQQPGRQIHARHFSSPHSGTVEDAATGTASAATGAYYASYIDPGKPEYQLVMEQGQEMGKDGEISVEVTRTEAGLDVSIAGTAVYVKTMEV